MSILANHIIELRYRLFYSFLSIFFSLCVCFFKSSILIFFLAKPFIFCMKNDDFDFIFTNIIDIFEICIIVCFYFCIFANAPILLLYFYYFLRPGLYKYEKLFLKNCLILLIINSYASFICIYFIVFPISLIFILNINVIQDVNFLLIKLTPKLTDYIHIFIKFSFFYSLFLFQIPVLFYIFGLYFDISCYFFFKKRKIMMIFNFFVCFIFAPSDFTGWFFFSIPTVLLIELGIFFFVLKESYLLEYKTSNV